MPKIRLESRIAWLGFGLLCVAVPTAALAALTGQGITAQGITAQGITAQGITAQGITAQGITAQGVALIGTDVLAADLRGVNVQSVEIRGTTATSPVEGHELTSGPGISTGTGSYIAVGGASVVGRYAVAHLADSAGNPAEDIDLFIAAERPDPVPNLLHRGDAQGNDDVFLYTPLFFHKWSGQWASLCPVDPATGGATALAIPEDPIAAPKSFIFACTATGVASKCARTWGYAPWRTEVTWFYDDVTSSWIEKKFELKPYYDACKTAARAAYCQDEKSFTKNGTLVDLYDTRQFIWPNAIENPLNALNPDSQWMFAQEYFVSFDPLVSDPAMKATALQRTRYRELSPVGECANLAKIDRLEHDHFGDGRWANPLVATPRIEVFSPNYCTHSENQVGEALPWDCSPCTTAICRTMPRCCSPDPGLPQPAWDAACVAERLNVCRDFPAAPLWPVGKVWPRDLPATTVPKPPLKYLMGPGGAVERVDGVSAAATAATVSGWACDPEWPGATVAVAIYGGAPRGQPGSVLLGETRAELAMPLPLAREVSAACDGPNKTTARHGFSFTLPAGHTGNVYAYALDEATTDGPAAPPTLLRNGIVHVPTCPHSEFVVGEALDRTCSTCVDSVCDHPETGDCCVTGWTAACTQAAEVCQPQHRSAAANERSFAAVATGWIEAPVAGTYSFSSGLVPSRLFVNGKKLIDWWEAPGATSGSVELGAGGKYHIRWDRFQSAPPPSGGAAGLTWRLPGAAVDTPIPSSLMYRVSPGNGTGLRATYFDGLNLSGASVTKVDATVDISMTTPLPPPVALPDYSAVWEGELIPTFSEAYTFFVVGKGTASLTVDGQPLLTPPPPPAPPVAPGCGHDICALGDKLAASTSTSTACHSCVDQICATDPYCCNGGYTSYYSSEPVWDAKCVAEVTSVCGLDCKNPLPTPTTAQRKSTPITLQAGARYRIRLRVDNNTSDRTVQLLWASARQSKQVIPSHLLFPPVAAASAGAGLNLVAFATKQDGGVTKPDLDTLRASGAITDLALLPASGPNGLPLIEAIASPVDVASATPPPPAIVAPRYQGLVFGASPTVALRGIGGLSGGSVSVKVLGTGVSLLLPIAGDGSFQGDVPVGSYGAKTLVLTQRTWDGPVCGPPARVCAESPPVNWEVTVDPEAPPVPPAPTINFPRDPTASMDPTQNVFQVVGQTTPGGVPSVCELGGSGATVVPNLTVAADGTLGGTITLSAGNPGDPNPGWHKLVFTKGACLGASASRPVFVSVGIRPPTVEFPRTGAEIDCTDGVGDRRSFVAKGRIPYDVARFGNLYVLEETGRAELNLVSRAPRVLPQPNPDGSFNFETTVFLGYGKHLIYFFQAPDPPQNATPEEVTAHFRAFASLANTPQSRVEVTVPPPPMGLTLRGNVLLPPGSPFKISGGGNCDASQPRPDCAQPHADVNVRIGPRLFTARASATGSWGLELNAAPGFHDLFISQVVDSAAGGGWQESCPSKPIKVGIPTQGKPPKLILPADKVVEATSRAGAKVEYKVDVERVGSLLYKIECSPPSGATFPIGLTEVHCTATEPVTGGVGVGSFFITVVDGPPVVNVPPKGIVAEATNKFGAFVSYKITATDAVSGELTADCSPSAPPGSPVLFPLNQDTTVLCQATDEAHNTATGSFVVRVRDTTGPTLVLPGTRFAVATSRRGARVTYSATATDIADAAPKVTCTPASGSTFPLGTTIVTCTAVDSSGNSRQGTFAVRVTVGWSGLLPPISPNGSSTFLRGLPIPVRFELAGASGAINDLQAFLHIAPLDAAGRPRTERPAPGLPPGAGNLFRFVPLVNDYLMALDTRTMTAGPWQLRVALGDGEVHATRILIR